MRVLLLLLLDAPLPAVEGAAEIQHKAEPEVLLLLLPEEPVGQTVRQPVGPVELVRMMMAGREAAVETVRHLVQEQGVRGEIMARAAVVVGREMAIRFHQLAGRAQPVFAESGVGSIGAA